MFIGESNLKRKIQETYVENYLAQNYFSESWVYVLEGKLHTKVMQEVHKSPMVGHHGEKTTMDLLGKTFYWLEMKEDVEHYVHMFIKCQSIKSIHKK